MDRNTIVLILFALGGLGLAVINRYISPPKKVEPSLVPKQRELWAVSLIASTIIWLISAFVIGLTEQDFSVLTFLYTFYPFGIFSLPFTYLITMFYRKAKKPSRFELLAAVLGGGLGVLLLWIVSNIR